MVKREQLVVHFLAVFAIGLFTVGFIAPGGLELTPESKSSAVENANLLQFQKLLKEFDSRNGSSPQPTQRLVLMVVDALRDDFLDRTDNLPYVSGELKANRACRVAVKVDTPTVTMPRIKSLVTGKASNFLDIILNLGSAELKGSNLVNNVASKGAVFYGDETWLKLLPNSFIRQEGTHSFFVNDFYEVDENVTRHVSSEMKKQDWHLLILHFLGLDHIGHVEGPRSALVGPKLQEMDSVIESVRSNGAQSPLLLLTGDHGMHDGGGHGGATASERNVGLVLLGTRCASGGPSGSWAQVDLATTMAVLLGVDVPEGSAGALVPPLLAPLGQRGALTAQFNNAKRLLLAAPGAKQESFIMEGMRLHRSWLRGENSEGANRAMELYTEASILMRNSLATNYAPFDLYAMALGAIIAVICAVRSLLPINCLPSAFRTGVVSAALLGVHSILCGIGDGKSTACSLSPLSLCLQLTTALAFAQTCCSIASSVTEVHIKFPKDWPLLALPIFHTFSLGSSFCVEEEHLVWYAVWPLVLVYAMVRRPQRWPLLVLMLLGHVMLSHVNSTGDKWASAPDLEDWLASRPVARSAAMASGLLMIVPLIASCRLMAAILLVAVYLHKAANKNVLLPYVGQRLSQSGLVEAWYFYGLLTVYVLLRLSRARPGQRTIVWRDAWLLVCAILRRPHDLWSLAYVAISSRLIAASHGGPSAAVAAGAVGWAGFYYQGNSNGLATLDVAAGYVGLSSYRPLLVAAQMIAHTFSAPVLVALELAASQGLDGRWVAAWSGQRLAAAAFYLLVAAWLREHLFVWSVFAPKLLYEGAHTLVYLVVLTIFKVSSL